MDLLTQQAYKYKSHPDYCLLSGAGRKRFWRLIKQKVPPKDALEIATQRWSDLRREGVLEKGKRLKKTFFNEAGWDNSMREYEYEPSTNQALNKKSKVHQTETITEKPKGNTSNVNNVETPKQSDTVKPITSTNPKILTAQVEIHNTEIMSLDQMKMVHHFILSEISNCEEGTGPSFYGLKYQDGSLSFTCDNSYSLIWLEKRIQEMKPWPEANLSLKLTSPTSKVTTFLPKSESDNIEKHLKLLRVQNKGFNTRHWKVLNEKEFEGGYIVTFAIDALSMKALTENKFKAIFGFKNIIFKIKPLFKINASESEKSKSATKDASLKENGVASEIVNLVNDEEVTKESNGDINSKQVEKPCASSSQ